MSRIHPAFLRSITGLWLAGMVASCGSLLPSQHYSVRTDWPLAPPPEGEAAVPPTYKVLVVRDITAGPGLDRRGLAALDANGAVHYDYYNQWAVDPAEAVTGDLALWLTASGVFPAVVQPGSRLEPDVIVEGELTEFVADIPAGKARAVLTVTALGAKGGVVSLLVQRRIEGQAALTGTSPDALVGSERRALADALRQSVNCIAAAARAE